MKKKTTDHASNGRHARDASYLRVRNRVQVRAPTRTMLRDCMTPRTRSCRAAITRNPPEYTRTQLYTVSSDLYLCIYVSISVCVSLCPPLLLALSTRAVTTIATLSVCLSVSVVPFRAFRLSIYICLVPHRRRCRTE